MENEKKLVTPAGLQQTIGPANGKAANPELGESPDANALSYGE
jgi:hypothetical protein